MPLGNTYSDSVLFVCADRDGEKVPVGTAFLIDHANDKLPMTYAVTARHVIESEAPTWLRFRGRDSSRPPIELPVSEWIQHSAADVAIAPLALAGEVQPSIRATPISTDAFADRWLDQRGVALGPGDRVYVIGLLADLHSMVTRSIPMVRAGTLGALDQEDVPMRSGLLTRREPVAHLIDAQVRAGFSGSPCVAEQLSVNTRQGTVFPYLALLGVVIGHFNSYLEVESLQEGDVRGDLRVPENSRVAIVTPVEAVRELLENESIPQGRQAAP